MMPQPPIREQEAANWTFFDAIPYRIARASYLTLSKTHSSLIPCLIFRRLRRLRRNPLYQIGNPTLRRPDGYRQCHRLLLHLRRQPAHNTLYDQYDGRGPAWSNSLFEDNAEFGLGMRLTIDKFVEFANELVAKLAGKIGQDLADALLNADQSTEAGWKNSANGLNSSR